jgi:hypothetical protein
MVSHTYPWGKYKKWMITPRTLEAGGQILGIESMPYNWMRDFKFNIAKWHAI